jgi:MoxR-like ATPase
MSAKATKSNSIIFAAPEWAKEADAELLLEKVEEFYQKMTNEVQKVIIGQKEVIDLILIAILCKGHVLLEGVPGLGKTLTFRTLSRIMNLIFHHVQFTPDLMPSDIIGTEIIQQNAQTQYRELKFLQGPIFCHFLLSDEINRASPRTQSALLQAMQDREVSVGKHTYKLEEPFFVLATQNPIDQEGVYPLPEAQLDRFMFNVFIDYPKHNEEVEIVRKYSQSDVQVVSPIIEKEDLLQLQTMTRAMLVSEPVLWYAVDLVTATRPGKTNNYDVAKEWIRWGAGPRASINLILAAKAHALLNGRLCASMDDVRAVAPSVLRHRIRINFSAEAEGISSNEVISRLIKEVPEPKK